MSAFKGFTPPTEDDEDMQQQAPQRPESALANELNKLNLKRQKTASPEMVQHNYAHANPIIAQAGRMMPVIRIAHEFLKKLGGYRHEEPRAIARKFVAVAKPYFLLEFYYDRGDLEGLTAQFFKVKDLSDLMRAARIARMELQRVNGPPEIYKMLEKMYDALPWGMMVERGYTPSPIQRPKRRRDLQEMIYSLTV